jgi:glycosyltransferase involved in cell wall biosynthesis
MSKASERPMHIVYLVTKPKHVSGGMRVITEHLNGLIARGHKAELWVVGNELHTIFSCNAEIKNFEPEQLLAPDIVVMCDPGFMPQVAEHRGDKASFFFIQHDIEWIDSWYSTPSFIGLINNYTGHFARGSWHVLTVSTWLQQLIAEKYGLESFLVPNGIDRTLFKPAKPMLDTSNPTLLLYYDHQPWKGFVEAVSAALEVKELRNDVEIIILGNILSFYPEANPAYQRFSFPVVSFNNPDQNDLCRIYSSATVFISASWKEGFGLPGLEAMACGVPVVTTDGGGNRDYAIPDETAVVVPPQNVPALTEGILRVLDDVALRAKLVKNGLKKAQEFGWEQSIAKLEEVLVLTSHIPYNL